MIRLCALVAAAAALTYCGDPSRPTATGTGATQSAVAEDGEAHGAIAATVRMDWVYTLAGVQIIDEGDVGPEPLAMAEALGAYRRAINAELEGHDEAARWAALVEIRWTAEELEGGGTYDGEGRVRLTYRGCVIDSALFALLLEHYAAEGLELEADQAWADELAASLSELCG
jgi:hypothetical protein